jgi:uncharacterized membrane protein YraQ (UPF0718 family)
MTALIDILSASWEVFLVASPYVLLGLCAAGLMTVLIPSEKVSRWLGQPGFGATLRAACLGIPLPLCSCAVVPVTIELSRKGASREASLAFLVSTPETGVDSILLTWGLMGPVMAVLRPVAALVTSLVAAASSLLATESPEPSLKVTTDARSQPGVAAVSQSPEVGMGSRLRKALRYGFVTMVDEIGFWLVSGFLLTGLITALVPGDLVESAVGQGPRALLTMLVMGIPLYMCASASTPVAAALMLKGISPGAALVFLLAGPATNASSLVVIAKVFGRRFVAIYLGSVVISALGMGYGLDLLLERLGISLQQPLAIGASESVGGMEAFSALVLGALILWSLARGSWRSAVKEMVADLKTWTRLFGHVERG